MSSPSDAVPHHAVRSGADSVDAVRVDDADDPRLADYVNLTDAELRTRYEAERGVFVVEGLLAIEALLRSTYRVRSVLLNDRAHRRLAPSLADLDAPVYVASDDVLRATVGFDLHRGAVASAYRPVDQDMHAILRRGQRLLVLEGVNDHENLGSLFRNAAAFAVDGVLLDPTCADPLYRRSVRVSLGHVLHVPFARAQSCTELLRALRSAGWVTVALTSSGSVDVRDLDRILAERHLDNRLALLLGAEGPGLSDATLAAADHRVRITLVPGVDSLNVATAAAVALHALSPRTEPRRR